MEEYRSTDDYDFKTLRCRKYRIFSTPEVDTIALTNNSKKPRASSDFKILSNARYSKEIMGSKGSSRASLDNISPIKLKLIKCEENENEKQAKLIKDTQSLKSTTCKSMDLSPGIGSSTVNHYLSKEVKYGSNSN